MKVVTLKIDEVLLERLDRLAAQQGKTRSDIIREAIKLYLLRPATYVRRQYIPIRRVSLV